MIVDYNAGRFGEHRQTSRSADNLQCSVRLQKAISLIDGYYWRPPPQTALMYSLKSSLPSNEDENENSDVILPAFTSFCGHFRPRPCPHSVLAVPPGRPQCRPGRHCHGGDEAAPRPQRGDARSATPSSTTTADGSAASARAARARRSPPSSRHSSQSSTENQHPPKHRRPQRW